MRHGRWVGLGLGALILGWAASADHLLVPVVVVGAGLFLIAARNTNVVSAALLVLAVPCMRPFLFGERYTPVAIALVAVAAGLAAVADRGQFQLSRAHRSLILWLGLLWAWMLVLLVLHPTYPVEITFRGVVGVPVVIVGACFVLRDDQRRDLVTRGAMVLVIATCASFVVTFALWQARGFGTSFLGALPAGYEAGSGGVDKGLDMFFPFTTVGGGTLHSGVLIPRFYGLGREPGVMAAVIGWSMFMVTRLGWRKIWVGVLIAGLAGTQSTAGFGITLGVFVLCVIMVVPPSLLGTAVGAARQFGGLVLLVAAVWLAIFAPAFGVEAKTEINAASVGDRQAGTMNGLHAAIEHPLGVDHLDPDLPAVASGINVIAGTAIIGVVGTGLIVLAMARPLLLSADRRGAAAPAMVIIGTAVTAQPMLQSTGFFFLIAIAVGLTATGTNTLKPSADNGSSASELHSIAAVGPVTTGR